MRAARRETREAFQASRGVAILIVVIFHADLALASLRHYQTFAAVRDALRFIPMPLFFLSVGMSLAPAFERGYAPAHLARRAVHYGYLFLVWTLIDIGIMGVIFPQSLYLKTLIAAFVHPNNSLWFLYALMLQLILFGSISQCSKLYQTIVPLILVFLSNFVHSPLATNTLINMIFLVIGARFCGIFLEIIRWTRGWAVIAALILYAILASIIHDVHSIATVFLSVLASLVGIVGLVALFRWLLHFRIMSPFRYLGRSSFEIYILHSYFVMAFVRVAALSDPDVQGRMSMEILLTFSSLATAVIGSLIACRFIRNINWLFSKPHWVVARVEPIFVSLIETIANFGGHPRSNAVSTSEARPG